MNGKLKLSVILLVMFGSTALLPMTGLTFSPISLTPVNAVSPYESIGRATGKGQIAVAGGTAKFDFFVQHKAGEALTGQLSYINFQEGTDLQSVAVTSFTEFGNTATFGGTCLNNGAPCTFFVQASDPRHGGSDTFVISVSGGPDEGGAVSKGNIQIR